MSLVTALQSYKLHPHDGMFNHDHRYSNGKAIPFWLRPGPVYTKRNVCNKHCLLFNEAGLLQLNPNYARVGNASCYKKCLL